MTLESFMTIFFFPDIKDTVHPWWLCMLEEAGTQIYTQLSCEKSANWDANIHNSFPRLSTRQTICRWAFTGTKSIKNWYDFTNFHGLSDNSLWLTHISGILLHHVTALRTGTQNKVALVRVRESNHIIKSSFKEIFLNPNFKRQRVDQLRAVLVKVDSESRAQGARRGVHQWGH